MKKRLMSLMLVLCMLCSLLPMAALAAPEDQKTAAKPAQTFNDIGKRDWFYDAVRYVNANGIFNGTGPDTFDPDGTMTRGMFVTVLGRLAGIDPQDYAGETGFGDVPSSQYYAPYVKWAAQYGITTGTESDSFSPDALINREQMAVFFVRYFGAFGVDYETGANITTVPADLESISPYAREAVLKLWKQGLLSGDGVKFNPSSNASRAETAALCQRADEAVDTWYKEPGVASDRVRVTPDEEPETEPEKEPEKPGTQDPSPIFPGDSTTKYYEVKFELGDGQDSEGVTLPETALYASGTNISAIPTPYKQNAIFLGWYYDAEMTLRAASNDTVRRNMTLYAKLTESTGISSLETPDYMTVSVAANDVGSFCFGISGYTPECITSFINVTNNKSAVTFDIAGDGQTVNAVFAEGQTYRVELDEFSGARFIVGGIAQPETIRVLNIITEKSPVQNLQLGGVKYLPSGAVTNMTGAALDGLFNASVGARSMSGGVAENRYEGTFTYTGSGIAVGDTAAVYSGTRPDLRKCDAYEDGPVAYVEITGIEGTTYTYRAADAENVLFTPDVLPVPVSADTDGSDSNNSITVALSVMDYSDDVYEMMALDSRTTVDVGDYIAFYTGSNVKTGTNAGYGKITRVTESDAYYVIEYTPVTEDELLAAMDLYMTRNEEIELTDAEKKRIESELEMQALESGFVEEAAAYLTALALETEGFKELADDMDLSPSAYTITYADGTPVSDETLQLMAGETKVEIKDREVRAAVAWGKVLQHFEGKYGVRVELAILFTIEVDGQYEINLQAIFEQEVLLTVNTSGGAIWKWAWIIPYIYDYNLNANIDLGTFTGIGITATAKSIAEEEEGYSWKPVTDYTAEQAIINIGKEIAALMEAKEEFLGEKLVTEDGDEFEWGGTNGGGLVEKYSAMLEEAEDTWVEVYRSEIFSLEGSVDPFHILVYGISADFVVKTNLYVTMGMTFEYGIAKRYNFSIMLFHKKSTNEVIDLEEHHYQFDFYVMGTAGFRAGVELEVGVGLFSLDLDSVGICAETGVYAQLWGYFYYHLKWTESGGKESSCAGALLIEVGVYLEITFKAQLFSSEKLTYQPTLYENEWPFISIGEPENVYDFAYDGDDDRLTMAVESARSFSVPTTLFEMNYMDLKTGELYGTEGEGADYPPKNFDDARESYFVVSVSNPKFSYNPDNNVVTVNPGYSYEEDCEITFTWKGGPAAFTTKPIKRTLTIKWTDPKDTYYIAFNTKGGSVVSAITARGGAPISCPADPTKTGYIFDGWYADYNCSPSKRVNYFPANMPESPDKGITFYAKWIPATNTKYKVEHYLQELNGTYTLYETETNTGTTDASTSAAAKTKEHNPIYDHFTSKAFAQQSIAPDGSTVVKVYYNRKTYDVKFTYGSLASDDLPPLTNTTKYGSTVYPPKMALGGYDFDGFDGLSLTEDGGLLVTGNATYNAKWRARTDTPYRVEHYIRPVSGTGYLLSVTEAKTGETASLVTAESLKLTDAGFSYESATVGGESKTTFTVSSDGKTVVKLYYARNSYTLTFMSDGNVHQSGSMPYGARLQAPAATPTKAGYTFSSWYDNAEFSGSAFSFESAPTMPAKHFTLYAKWTPRSDIAYKVEHYKQLANGEYSATPDDIDSLNGVTDAAVSASPKNYPHFTLDEAKSVSSGTVLADGSLVLKLYYARNTYTLTFKNADDSVIQSTLVRHGASITAPTPTVNPGPGYDLSWWPAVPGVMPAEDSTYKAVWTPQNGIKYTVEYYWQNAEDDGYTREPLDLTGTTGASVTAPETSRSGFSENTTHPERLVEGVIAGDGSLVLRRYYDRVTFTVTLDAAGGTLSGSSERTFRYGQKMTVPNPTRGEDYAFDGWFDESGTKYDGNHVVIGGLNLTARWTAGSVNYTVEHYIPDTTGASVTPISETKSGIVDEMIVLSSLRATTREVENGIAFELSKVDGEQVTSAPIRKGMVVQLYYTRYAHEVDWVLNGGDQTGGSYPDTAFYEQQITLPIPTKTGHEFDGWYTDEALEDAFDGVMGTEDLTLYAKWKVKQYTITFETAEGQTFETHTFSFGASVNVSPVPSRLGYTFTGWNAAIPASMPAYNVTLTAQWTVDTYTITYNLDGGEHTNRTAYTVEDNFTLTAPTRPGYRFLGWEGTDLTERSTSVTIQNRTGPREYTAFWELVNYNMTYTLNGGTHTGNPEAYNVTTQVTLNRPTREGYTFLGWTGTGITGGAVQDLSLPITGVTEDLYLTATWSATPYTITYYGLEGISHGNPSTYTIESEFELAAPEKDGFDFVGWTGTGITGDPKPRVSIEKGTTGPLEYTANWQVSDFKITKLEHLIQLREDVNNGTWGTKIAYLETNLILPADWEGIGTSSNPFLGVFEGNNFTISYVGSDTAYQNAPLFKTNKGTIQNLKITISGVVRISGAFGAVADTNDSGIVQNCHVAPADNTGSRIVQENAGSTTGGVVATNKGGYDPPGRIIDCSVGRGISSPLIIEKLGASGSHVGGIVGSNMGYELESFPKKSLIEYTANFSNPFSNDAGIYVKLVAAQEGTSFGGISGYNSRSEIQFRKSVHIYASLEANSKKQYLGGIVGHTNSLTEIYGPASGPKVEVTCSVETTYNQVYVGGIVGSNYSVIGQNIHVNPMDLTGVHSGVYDIDNNLPFKEGKYVGLVGLFQYTNGVEETNYNTTGSYYGNP